MSSLVTLVYQLLGTESMQCTLGQRSEGRAKQMATRSVTGRVLSSFFTLLQRRRPGQEPSA